MQSKHRNSSSDNFIIKNRMESGTILHLALLKKLCSGSHKNNYLNKFRNFRTVHTHHSNRTASSPHTSTQLFQKYPKSHRELNFIRTKSHSLDEKRKKYSHSKIQLQQSMNLCGWNVENEQDYNYDKFFKRNNHPVSTFQLKTPKRQLKRQGRCIKQKKFTYCEQDIDQFFKQIKISNTNTDKKQIQPIKQKNARLKPLFIEDIKTQSPSVSSNRPIYVDKQNLLSEELQLISTHKLSKFRKKTKAHPINELGRGFLVEINCKRIC